MERLQSVSTLMDGELDAEEAAREFAKLKSDAASCETWDTYHLIGDTMRGTGNIVGSPGFSARLSERLAQEPTVLAPRATCPVFAARRLQTYALRAAASVAAFAVVGWVAYTTLNPDAPVGELAKAPLVQPQVAPLQPQDAAALIAAAKPATAPEHVHEYLLAHQGISPTTAIQGVTPYIRTVSAAGN